MAQFANMFSVDLQKPTTPQPLRRVIGEGDVNGLRVGAYVYDDGEPVTLGGQCVGKVILPDGSSETLTGVIAGNAAYVVLDGTACAIGGAIQVAVCWVSGSDVTTLLMAYGTVSGTVAGGQVSPSTPLPDITQLLAEIEAMREATADAEEVLDMQSTVNLTGRFEFTQGKRIEYATGTMVNGSNVCASDFADVSGYKYIIITRRYHTGSYSGAYGLAFYSTASASDYISGVIDPSAESHANNYIFQRVPVPAGASYVRTTWWGSGTTQYQEIDFACYGETDAIYVDTASFEARAAELQADIDAADTQITGLSEDVEAVEDDVDALRGEVLRPTVNLFDKDEPGLITGYLNDSKTTIQSSSATRSITFPCVAGTKYTVSRDNGFYAFNVGFTATVSTPAVGDTTLTRVKTTTVYCDRTYIQTEAPETATYMVVYYYHGSHDQSSDMTGYLDSISITEGWNLIGYRPHGVTTFVDYTEMLPDDVQEAVSKINVISDRWTSRRNIYGIMFNTDDSTGTCTRFGDSSAGFDNIFPWCEMRLCNVQFVNGKKVVTYEEETGFARDGSNGNVMVEVPAFYVLRERFGTVERWMVSGTEYGGFELHPWFREPDGTPVTHRYYGAYAASVDGAAQGVFSRSGVGPYQYHNPDTIAYFEGLIAGTGLNRNSIQALSAITMLFCIEYATINSQTVFNGATYSPYYSQTNYKVKNPGETTNVIRVNNIAASFGNSFNFYSAGMDVAIATNTSNWFRRTISQISFVDSEVVITVQGDPIALTSNTVCCGISQKCGRTDVVEGSTGVEPGINWHVASFKWRNIENIWGNVWELLDGVRFKAGAYYLANTAQDGTQTTFAAPAITATDKSLLNWITRLGYDVNSRALLLADRLSPNGDGSGNVFFGDAFYSTDSDVTNTYLPAIGGGWDHHENAGIFCMRFLQVDAAPGWLYGERVTC